jgi:hypothetical protein
MSVTKGGGVAYVCGTNELSVLGFRYKSLFVEIEEILDHEDTFFIVWNRAVGVNGGIVGLTKNQSSMGCKEGEPDM